MRWLNETAARCSTPGKPPASAGWKAALSCSRRRCRSRGWLGTACVFFFQAEDCIRDGTVTGVQTCALPICLLKQPSPGEHYVERGLVRSHQSALKDRSEERRVGKECRCRWLLYH